MKTQLIPGIVLAASVGCLSIAVSHAPWLQSTGISALTLAIVLGMAIGNTVYPFFARVSCPGVGFSKQSLLRLGIVLYGLRLTFQDIGRVGVAGVLIDTAVVCSTFALAWILGTRVFGLDRKTSMLIGAGSSICGAAAVLATEPVVRGRTEQVTVAVSTVVVFGTVAIFLYPALYGLNLKYQMLPAATPISYGLFVGSTIHEVAQVVAAGNAVGAQAANTAVIVKMVRVMMLAPFLLTLSAYLSKSEMSSGGGAKSRIAIPWFALGFIALAALNSAVPLPHRFVDVATCFDTVVLATAMAALGLTTHASAIRSAGIRPLALASVLFVWLVGGGLLINAAVSGWTG
jgi:uncharacterized integral membrane protein (TIGR00698 family)